MCDISIVLTSWEWCGNITRAQRQPPTPPHASKSLMRMPRSVLKHISFEHLTVGPGFILHCSIDFQGSGRGCPASRTFDYWVHSFYDCTCMDNKVLMLDKNNRRLHIFEAAMAFAVNALGNIRWQVIVVKRLLVVFEDQVQCCNSAVNIGLVERMKCWSNAHTWCGNHTPLHCQVQNCL